MTTIADRRPARPGSPEYHQLLAAVAEGASERDRHRVAPFDQVQLLAAAGIGRLRIPQADGGGGATLRELFEVVIDLARADPNVAHILRAHFGFVEQAVRLPVSPARQAAVDLVNSGAIIGNAVSEQGNKPVGRFYDTLLSRTPDGLRLNGVKYYSTGTMYSDWIEVLACDDDADIVSILVPVDRTGISIEDDWDGFGQRLTGTGTTSFVDVEIAAHEVYVLGPPDDLRGTAQHTFFQLYLQALTSGILLGVQDDAIGLVTTRVRNFSHAPSPVPSDDPHLLAIVGEIAADAFAARSIVLSAADVVQRADVVHPADVADPGAPRAAGSLEEAQFAAAAAKVTIDRLAATAASRLFDVGGASATSSRVNLDRHWRNIRTISTHNPTVLKSAAIGELLVNGTALPGNGYF